MKRLFLAFIAVMFAAASGRGGESPAPAIRATVMPKKATVGSVLEYRVSIAAKGRSAVTVVPPEKRDYFPPKKEAAAPVKTGDSGEKEEDPAQFVPLYAIHTIKKEDRSDTTMTDITVSVQISFYRPGTWQLPDIEITGADGVAIGYQVPTVEIAAVNEKGEFQEIEPPLELSGNWWRYLFVALGFAAAAAASYCAWRYVAKLREARKNAPVIIPPLDIFLDEIGRFGGERLIDEGKIEEFVFGISMIFRKYLSLQFRFDATDMTTYEIENKIRRLFPAGLFDKYFHDIMRSLNLWDLSKFAEFTPSRELLHASLAETIGLAKNLSGDMNNAVPRV